MDHHRCQISKMNRVLTIAHRDRTISKQWLLGLTLGWYMIPSVALYFFGGGGWISNYKYSFVRSPPAGQLQSSVLLIPGLLVALLGFAQIYSDRLFQQKANETLTSSSIWLSTASCTDCRNDAIQTWDLGFVALFIHPALFIIAAIFWLYILLGVLNLGGVACDRFRKRSVFG